MSHGVAVSVGRATAPRGFSATRWPLAVGRTRSIPIRPGDKETFDRYWQDLMYGGVQHHTTYVRLRQAQEGVHGFAKAHAAQARQPPGATRARQGRPVAVRCLPLLAAASVAKIRTFLHTAETDATGERWVERAPLTSALRTPPGDKNPDADPDPPPDQLPDAA